MGLKVRVIAKGPGDSEFERALGILLGEGLSERKTPPHFVPDGFIEQNINIPGRCRTMTSQVGVFLSRISILEALRESDPAFANWWEKHGPLTRGPIEGLFLLKEGEFGFV